MVLGVSRRNFVAQKETKTLNKDKEFCGVSGDQSQHFNMRLNCEMLYRYWCFGRFICHVMVVMLSLSMWIAQPASSVCNNSAPLRHGSVIHVAVLVWIADEPNGLYRGYVGDTRAVDLPYANNFVQPYMLGVELYIKQMRDQGALPLPDGQSVTLNFVSLFCFNGITGSMHKEKWCENVHTNKLPR